MISFVFPISRFNSDRQISAFLPSDSRSSGSRGSPNTPSGEALSREKHGSLPIFRMICRSGKRSLFFYLRQEHFYLHQGHPRLHSSVLSVKRHAACRTNAHLGSDPRHSVTCAAAPGRFRIPRDLHPAPRLGTQRPIAVPRYRLPLGNKGFQPIAYGDLDVPDRLFFRVSVRAAPRHCGAMCTIPPVFPLQMHSVTVCLHTPPPLVAASTS